MTWISAGPCCQFWRFKLVILIEKNKNKNKNKVWHPEDSGDLSCWSGYLGWRRTHISNSNTHILSYSNQRSSWSALYLVPETCSPPQAELTCRGSRGSLCVLSFPLAGLWAAPARARKSSWCFQFILKALKNLWMEKWAVTTSEESLHWKALPLLETLFREQHLIISGTPDLRLNKWKTSGFLWIIFFKKQCQEKPEKV